MSRGITRRQSEVLAYLTETIATKGRPPALREVCAHFGWHSVVAARDHLRALEKKGYVARDAGEHRGLRILGTVSSPPDAVRLGAPVAVRDPNGRPIARFWPVGQERAEQIATTEAAA